MRFVLVALLLAVVAGEYDACTRPDAVFASWDQAFSRRTPAHTPCATTLILPITTMRHRHAHAPHAHCQPCRVDRGINGRSVGYGAIQSGGDIYILGDACASPSHT